MLKNYAFLILLMVCFTSTSSMAQDYQVLLRGNHQPTPVLSTASGALALTLSGDSLQVGGDFSGIITGVDTTIAGGAHIHEGLAGQNGSVAFPLKPTLSEGLNDGMFEVASNTFALDEDQKAALAARKFYINIHSSRFGSGEIRGQILPVADEVYTASLFGSNQTNSVMSNAQGAVVAELHGDTIVVSGSFQNLSSALAADISGGIHIHQGIAGSNGGVLRPLNVTIAVDSLSAEIDAAANTFVATAEELGNLQSEGWYVNVHSQNWRGGEIRGQLTPVAEIKLRTHLSGANEVPSITSFASGKLAVAIRDGNITVSGSFTGLESDFNAGVAGGAHIHLGMAGQNGGIGFPLVTSLNADGSGFFDPADNTFPVDEDQLAAIVGRGTYVNIHTTGHPGGELRGQILPESNYFLNAILTGSQQPAAVPTDAQGAVIVEVLGGGITASGSFNNLSSALATEINNGAHIHLAPVGSNGPVAYALAPTPGDDAMNGTWRAVDNRFGTSPGRQDTLRARGGYINVHSANWRSGEIRGQLMHEARAYFYTPLSGAEEVPAVLTTGFGGAMMEYNGTQALVVGSFAGLTSPLNTAIAGGAHIHAAYAGSNGGVLTPLVVAQGTDATEGVFELSDNVYDVTVGWMDTVRQRGTYINIHSENVGSGELRGQFRPLASKYYLSNLRGKNISNPASSTGLGSIILEQTGSALTTSGSFNNLMSSFATDVAGGAHLHVGMPGMNGGILVRLNSISGDDGLSAWFPADSNVVVMDDTTRMMLEAGNSYVNIHSADARGGEIRGQALLEINYAPDVTVFSEPSSGDTILTSGDPSAEFAARWDASTDPNGNKVVYLWQLSTTRDFTTPVLSVNTGEATEFVTTLGAVDTLLSTLGVDSGSVVTVYHRVSASDGSLCASSTIDSVYLVRGTLTDIKENPFLKHTFTLYPSPAFERIQLDIDMKQRAEGELQILDLEGKVLYQQRLQLSEGLNLVQQQVSTLVGGTYLARLIVNREIAVARKFIKY